ncbi:MAG: lacto-N-biose phosphorylase central domain-containing protein, partial [Bifidobacterium sp.]|nr:lacto-N-biose phosphorylase central domain-containing protein [Bifidobacterium sp.]
YFQLADVLGVDQERFRTLSVDKYPPAAADAHFITADLPAQADFGEPIVNTYAINEQVTLLRATDGGDVQLAANDYGQGRGVYVSGLPYSAVNARLLERALFYAAHAEDRYDAWSSTNPECEVAVFPDAGTYCVVNNTDRPQSTRVRRADGGEDTFELAASAIAWRATDGTDA